MAKKWSWNYNQNQMTADHVEIATPPKIPDEYWERLIKAVPVVAVGFVTAASALAAAAPTGWVRWAMLFVLIFGLALAWIDMSWWRHAGKKEVGVGLAAYLIWSYAQGGFFEAVDIWQPVLAGLLALAFAAVIPYLAKRPPAPPPS